MPDAHPLLPWLTPARRAWLYRVCTAGAPLAVAYGLASDAKAVLWLGVVGAALGTGTAALHTPTKG